MADLRTVRVTTLEEIPFRKIIVGKTYMLMNATPQMANEARSQLEASPVAVGRKPVVIREWTIPGAYRVFIARPKKATAEPRSPGRPLGRLAHALTKFEIGQTGIEFRGGKTAQSIRNICSKTAARYGMTLKVEAIKQGTPVPEIAIDWEIYGDGDFFRITRTA